jgi:sugar phosphate isomerase/epimerase
MREIVIPTFYSMSQPISGTLEQLAAAGVRLVELHGDAPDTHIDLTDEAAMEAVSEVVSGLPIDVHSVHCAFSMPSEEAWDISQPDQTSRAAALRNRMKVIRTSARLGVHHVTVHPGARHRGEEPLAHSRAGLAQLAETARDVGMRIAVENLPPDQLGGSLAELEWVLDGLDPAVVGFCLDTGHAMLGRDTVGDYIRALGYRMFGIHWHANDCSDDAHLFPDVGQAKWDEFFAALDEVGYDLPVTLEAVPPEATPLEEALQSVRGALQGERTHRVA